MKLIFSMINFPLSGMTFRTLPLLPFSLPVTTITRSFFLIWSLGAIISKSFLQDLGCQRDDLHESFGSKFPCNGTENAGSDRFSLGIDENSGIIIKFDVRPIQPFHLF